MSFLTADVRRHSQTFYSADLAEQKIQSLCDKSKYRKTLEMVSKPQIRFKGKVQILNYMKQSRITKIVAFTYLLLFVIIGVDSLNRVTYSGQRPQPQNSSSSSIIALNTIDMHWGGRLKAIGSATFAKDDTIFEPVGSGTYLNLDTDLRINNEIFFSDWGYFETQYELILNGGETRKKNRELREIFPNFQEGAFFLDTPLDDDNRFMNLTHTIKEENSYILLQRIDRLNLTLKPNWGLARIGRQAITWGNGLIFNPMDLFNPFPPTDIQRDYKIGDDMALAQITLPNTVDLQLLYVLRRDPDTHNVEADQNSLAGLLHFAFGTTEFDVMATRHYDDYVVGSGVTGILGGAAWRADATWTFLDGGDNYLSVVTNVDYSWAWWAKNFYGMIEYYYNGLGRNNYPQALLNPNIGERIRRGELFVLGKNYMSAEIQAELHPLFSVYLTAINNVKDPSGIIQPRAVWNITQDLDMIIGANIFYGANGDPGSELGGFIIPGTPIHSRSPNSAYLWFNYYF